MSTAVAGRGRPARILSIERERDGGIRISLSPGAARWIARGAAAVMLVLAPLVGLHLVRPSPSPAQPVQCIPRADGGTEHVPGGRQMIKQPFASPY